MIERRASADRPHPAYAIGFVLSKAAIEERVLWWSKNQGFFRRQDLYKGHIEDLRSVYIPAYLFSAAAYSDYSASIGEHYTETQTYSVRVNGRSQTRVRTVVKTEWRPLTGRYASYISDVLVTASRGVANAELEAIEPYDLRALTRYTPALVSGWPTEEPSVAAAEASHNARQEAIAATATQIARFMPGDSHRSLVHRTWLDRESIELLLVPVAVLALRYDDKAGPLRILLNGQTGRVLGRAPWSVPRLATAVGVVVAVIVGFIVLITVADGGEPRRRPSRAAPPPVVTTPAPPAPTTAPLKPTAPTKPTAPQLPTPRKPTTPKPTAQQPTAPPKPTTPKPTPKPTTPKGRGTR